ncbi:transposase [Clostridium cuniculi]|uniref:transposase n=1 Tax=Clostridium cuniculi TaxID=2548455 RepID=UPI001FAA4169|nr:transposase [Clostridium cuniculi]
MADSFYPSLKICSKCGEIKKDLKLKYRVYNCNCELSIDKYLNASINLSRYKLASAIKIGLMDQGIKKEL